MLTGYIKIKDKEMLKEFQDYYKLETPEELYYEIKGLDAITSLNLYIIGKQSGSESTETFRIKQRYFDFNKGEDTAKYRFEGDTVGFEKVVMNRRLDVKDTGNLSTNMENLLLATQISAGISYTKRYKPPQQVKTIGVEAAYEKTREVEIDEEGFKGKIVRNLGVIQLLEFENKFLKFHLSEVTNSDVFEETIDLSQTYFYKIQKKDNLDRIMSYTPIKNIGYKLNEETLGIPYEGDVKREIVNVGGVYTDIDDVIAHHPEKNTEWIKDRKYVIVTDEILDEVIQSFLDYDGYIAMDTETSGLNITFKSRANEAAQLVGLVLSKEEKTGYYFPLQHKLFKNLCDGDHYYFMRKYAKTLLETKDIVCHNGAYDWKVCYIYGINTNIVADTMLAFAVTKQYETPSYQIGLKALAASLLGNDMFDLDDFLVSGSLKNSNIAFWDLNYEIVRRYAPADADMTLTLWHYIRENKLLEEYNAEKVFQIEVEFSKVVAYSEFFGYRLDVEETSQLEADLKQQLAELEKEIYKMAGKEFNLRSPAQLSEVMFDELGIERIKGNSTGTKDVLKPLSKKTNADGSVKYPFVKVLKEYRDIDSIYTKFLTKLPQHMTPDGYIFSKTNQTGTTTGRVSVNDPNYQSFNDTVKKHIVPRPGYIMFDSDFSQIEYRVLCSLAHEKAIIEEFKDPDLDYHRYQAARMFSVPYASVTDALRSQSKGINFGLPYGMGDMSLGAAVFGERTPENGKKAAVLRNKYFEGQENILKFFEKVRGTGVDKGFTETYWGRRRYYQRGKFNEASIRRQAGNHTIQGTAADVYKLAVIRLFHAIVANRWLGKALINCFVHDEVLMEISKEINPYYFIKVWQNAFQLKIENFANLYSGMGFGKSWYVAKKADFPVQYCTALAEKYYKGMPWNQDLDGFLDDINNGYKEYKTQRVIDYIEENIEILKKTDPTEAEKEIQTQGEIIKPIIGQLLQAEVQNLLKNEEFREQKVKEHNYSEKEIKILTGEISNNQLNEQELDKQLQEQLKIFTEYHKIIGEYKIISPGAIQEENSEFTEEDYKKGLASTQTKTSKNLQLLVNGYSIDKTNKILYILDNVWYDEIKGKYQSAAKSVEEYIKYLHGDYDVALYADTEAMKKDKSTKYYSKALSDLDISVLEANLKIKNQQIKDILKNHSNKEIKGSIITDKAIEIFIPEKERFKDVRNS